MPQWKWNNKDYATALIDQNGDVVLEAMAGIAGDAWFSFQDEASKPLIAAAPEMYALLKECEWVSGVYESPCPICLECSPPHAPDCRLFAVLKAVEGE